MGIGRAEWRWDRWLIGAGLLCLVVVAPLVAVLFGLGQTGPEWGHVASTMLGDYLKNTAILAIVVSLLALLMALPAAWLVVTHEFPGRRVFEWALVLPLAFPTYVAALAYLQIPEMLIPTLVWVREQFGVDAFMLAQTLLRYGLLSVVLASVLFPYIYLSARTSFAHHNRALIEASQMLGQSGRATFFRIALPLSRPAIIAGLSLVVMEVLNDYGAVNLLGVPTLADGVFRTWFGLEDRVSAIRLAGLVTLIVLVLIGLEYAQRGKRSFADARTEERPIERCRLGRIGGIFAVICCGLPLTAGFLYPAWKLGQWSLLNLRDSVPSHFLPMLGRSLALAASASLMIVSVGFLLAFTARGCQSRSWKGLLRAATLGYAMPGAVVAVGVMMVFGNFDQWLDSNVLLSGTLLAVLFGYLTRFLAVAYQPISAGMDRLCGRLDEASQLLGDRRGRTFGRVILPLMRRPMLAAGMLVFVDVLKELPLTMILRPANFETLATKAFGLAKEGRIHEGALPSLAIVMVGSVVLIPLNRSLRGGGEQA